MDRQIDLVVQQRSLNFFGEHASSAKRLHGAGRLPVAVRRDSDDFDFDAELTEARGDEMGLPLRELAASGSDTDFGG